MKKFFSLSVTFALLVTLVIPCFASETSSHELPTIQVGAKIGNCTVVDI